MTWRDCRLCGVAMLSRRSLCSDCSFNWWIWICVGGAGLVAVLIALVDHLVKRFS